MLPLFFTWLLMRCIDALYLSKTPRPRRSTAVHGSPRQSTAVHGSPRQSTAVHGSPRQINYLSMHIVGHMYAARRVLNKSCWTNLYHTYIYPYLIYCILRIIRQVHYLAHTENIFKELYIEKNMYWSHRRFMFK